MTIHIQRFVDRLRAAESRAQRDLNMSLADAKDLHADITRLLCKLEDLQQHTPQSSADSVIQVQVTGGSF